MVNAQEWLDERYPIEKREKITELDISKEKLGEKLRGTLKLNGFKNLKDLNCSANKITTLDLSQCIKLQKLVCFANELVSLDLNNNDFLTEIFCQGNFIENIIFPNDSNNLQYLNLNSNNFSSQDLSKFSRFTSLRWIAIGNHMREKNNRGVYNRFYGSLEPLKSLNELNYLDISGTDIDSGLEYLPAEIDLDCNFHERLSAKVRKIEKELKNFSFTNNMGETRYDFLAWKESKEKNTFTTNLQLTIIKNNIQNLLILPNAQELEAIKSKLNIIHHTQWVSRGIIVGSSILSAYGSYSENHTYSFVGSCLTFPQPFLEFYLSRKEKELEKTQQEIEKKLEASSFGEPPQIIEELENNYQELNKVLDLKSEKSKEAKKIFTKIISDLQKEKTKFQQEENGGNGKHTKIIMSNAEQIEQFVQNFQNNWKETERTVAELCQELEREQMEIQEQIQVLTKKQ